MLSCNGGLLHAGSAYHSFLANWRTFELFWRLAFAGHIMFYEFSHRVERGYVAAWLPGRTALVEYLGELLDLAALRIPSGWW